MTPRKPKIKIVWNGCRYCEVAWDKHLGIEGTCKKLHEAGCEIKRLQKIIEEYEDQAIFMGEQ